MAALPAQSAQVAALTAQFTQVAALTAQPTRVAALTAQPSRVAALMDGAGPRTHAHKLATYYAWMASPLKPSTARGPPHLLPRYLQLELSRHVLRNIARFRLHAHTLRVETG